MFDTYTHLIDLIDPLDVLDTLLTIQFLYLHYKHNKPIEPFILFYRLSYIFYIRYSRTIILSSVVSAPHRTLQVLNIHHMILLIQRNIIGHSLLLEYPSQLARHFCSTYELMLILNCRRNPMVVLLIHHMYSIL